MCMLPVCCDLAATSRSCWPRRRTPACSSSRPTCAYWTCPPSAAGSRRTRLTSRWGVGDVPIEKEFCGDDLTLCVLWTVLLQLFFKDYAAAHLKLSELGQFQN